jgi:uncharacterized protein DUF4126
MINGLPLGLALATGVNTYLPLFILALFARLDSAQVHLSPPFRFLTSDAALIVLGSLAACEILAQKFPGLDNVWDFVHTLLRPVAGAVAAGAAVNTDRILEMAIVMLLGGALAAGAHSTKSSLRMASTAKTFGFANPVIALLEDLGVVAASLLSIYFPWIMLAVVVLFFIVLALVGPRVVRTISFDFSIVWAWFAWLARRVRGKARPVRLQESLLEVGPEELEGLKGGLEAEEELYGILPGWMRSAGGPRAGWLLVTSRRLVHIAPRFWRAPKVQSFDYAEVTLARSSRPGIMARIDLLTRKSDRVTMNLRRTHAPLAELAIIEINRRAPALLTATPEARATRPALATVPE